MSSELFATKLVTVIKRNRHQISMLIYVELTGPHWCRSRVKSTPPPPLQKMLLPPAIRLAYIKKPIQNRVKSAPNFGLCNLENVSLQN